jgi:hypothetical protein
MVELKRNHDRPLYKGMVVPYVVLIRPGGIPDFKINDIHKLIQCANEKLCTICGQKLDYWIWWLGGQKSMDKHEFLDGPMHQECADYSAQVCAYIAGGKGYAQQIKPVEGVQIVEYGPVDAYEVKAVPMFKAKSRRDATKGVINARQGYVKFYPPVLLQITPVGFYANQSVP